MSVKIDLTGKHFGRLTVISEAYSDGKHLYWKCRCDCGHELVVCGDSLKQGRTKSCGCLNSEMVKGRVLKHGYTYHRLYRIWRNMLYRCRNENCPEYPRYGGRGITVCDGWVKDFQLFYNWSMRSGYADNLTIDRIDNDGNYEPTNCQWLTRSENIRKSWQDRKKTSG